MYSSATLPVMAGCTGASPG